MSRLAPVTLLMHNADRSAVEESDWNAIAEHGTYAIAAWCEQWGIAGAKFLRLPAPDDSGWSRAIARLRGLHRSPQ